MVTIHQRITIVQMQKPRVHTLNDDLQWLGVSLGLFNLRDKDKSCFRIFIELLKSMQHNQPMTSDEIADKIGLSRGTIVHHLHKLEEAGLIVNDRNRYFLRDHNLSKLIDELEKDIHRTLSELKQVAKQVDEELGLEARRDSKTIL